MDIIMTIIWIAIGYIIGSIPWALVIGKLFYKTDIRQHGSGNLGGSNAGRVLGGKVGAIVIFLDAAKAFFVMFICSKFAPQAIAYAGIAACVGHCFPVFAEFKGGKAVATAYGFLLGLGVFGAADLVFVFVYPLLFFILILGISKMVALASCLSMLIATIISFLTCDNIMISIFILLLTAFIIYRHRSNIVRIVKHKENKITWLK